MLKRVISDERGRALALALIALGVGTLLLPTFLAKISTNLLAARATEVGIIEYYSSDAAIEYSLWRIKCEPGFRDSLTVGEPVSYTVPVGSEMVSVSLAQLSSGGGSNEVDAMLVLDRSTSMKDDGNGCTPPSCNNQEDCEGAGGVWDSEDGCTLPEYGNEAECESACCGSACGVWGPQPITSAKEAAKAFVNILEEYSVGSISHQVGLVSYSSSATLDKGLTTVYTDVRVAIDNLSANGYTGIGYAIDDAANELQKGEYARDDAVKAIVLLSDGKANVAPAGPPYYCSIPCYDAGEQYAEDMANTACYTTTTGGINFFTVALGDSADKDLMKYIARYDKSKAEACKPGNGKDLEDPDETPDFYQESPERGDLEDKFRRIALYLTSPQYNIIATTGDTTIESRVQHNEEYDMVGIFTWFTR